ncbi:MAG TPA: spondin domain-containing protein, partial [Polyangiaceae bacterium]|nr:spondin domain-containing protein [Polyangiaceae bacterium]
VLGSAAVLVVLGLVGCGGDGAAQPAESNGGAAGAGARANDGGEGGSSAGKGGRTNDSRGGSGGTKPQPPAQADFVITLENMTAGAALEARFETPIAILHTGANPLLDEAGQEIEGVSTFFANHGASWGGWDEDTEEFPGVDFFSPDQGNLELGDVVTFAFTAVEGQRVSIAVPYYDTTDGFFLTGAEGVALFDDDGNPRSDVDLAAELALYDAGVEAEAAPGTALWKVQDSLKREGGVALARLNWCSLPLAPGMLSVDVERDGEELTVTLKNVTDKSLALRTPLSSVFYALHSSDWQLFVPDAQSRPGLKALATAGDAATLVAERTGEDGLDELGSVAGPLLPGDSVSFTVAATAAAPLLTFATMVMETNDAFIAPPNTGIALLDDDGQPRSDDELEAEIRRNLTVWDAGAERDEAVGGGEYQPARGEGGNGDLIPTIRRYHFFDQFESQEEDDCLVQPSAYATVSQVDGFDYAVTVENPQLLGVDQQLSPLVWYVHDGNTPLFASGAEASAGLEKLAEDGDPALLLEELAARDGVSAAGIVGTERLLEGEAFPAFNVTTGVEQRYLNVVTALVPANDAFFTLGELGLEIVDAGGTPVSGLFHPEMRVADAGTEASQAGAAGPDMIHLQQTPNTGADEGNGMVRPWDDAVWYYPAATELLRGMLTLAPEEP